MQAPGRANGTQAPSRRSVTGPITLAAALSALLVAVSLPASLFFLYQGRLAGTLKVSARLHAAEVAEMARFNPFLWDIRELRLAPHQPDGAPAERRRVYDQRGRLILETPPAGILAWPHLSHREPVWRDGVQVGEVEATRSQRGVVLATLLSALLSGSFGALVFAALRLLPIRQMDRALRRANYLAAYDVLTGLPNRALFADRLEQALALARRHRTVLAVLTLNLDRFTEVNDTLGHAAGDEALKLVAARLRLCLGDGDTLARLGGDEFAVIQAAGGQPGAADELARRMAQVMARPVPLAPAPQLVGLSIGIAIAGPESGYDAVLLLRNADLALREAKAASPGGCRFFEPAMNRQLLERRALEADLREALACGTLRLVFQPQYALARRRITGAEALLRWDRPGFGPMPPDRFIPLAEETGLIVPIGEWVLREACRRAAAWPEEIGVAVNVSPAQFRRPGLFEAVAQALQDSGLPPHRLELEVTEGVLLTETTGTLDLLEKLHGLGVTIALDDFGTGYSSLGYLQRFAFDKIKIDRGFTRRLGQDDGALAIIRAVIGMSHALGIRSNAEGVESPEQAALLLAEGCNEAQGYLFGRPMPPEAFRRLVSQARAAPSPA